MRADDFLIYDDLEGTAFVNTSMLEALRSGPLEEGDLPSAIALATLMRQEFLERGTDNRTIMTSAESRLGMRALIAICGRIGVEFDPPFRDFDAFYSYWQGHNASGSWAARRTIVGDVFDGLRDELDRREDLLLQGDLAEPISPDRLTGWPRVDEELAEMRRHFHTASSAAEYSNVGNDAVAVLEAISAAAYDPNRHLREGEEEPGIDRTKQRIGRVIEDGLAGEGSDELKALVAKAIDLAQAVKHNRASTRLRAGVTADSVILLASIVRRVVG